MASKANKVGFMEVHGLEEFIEKKFHDFKQALGLEPKAGKKAVAATTPVKRAQKVVKTAKKAVAATANKVGEDVLGTLHMALEEHPMKAAVVKAGKKKDQLLRALIPLYLGRNAKGDISSGVTSKFWAKQGVKFAAPNAAKALREHKGYSTRSKTGVAISSNGVKYVESALKK